MNEQTRRVMHSSAKQNWGTPQELFDQLNAEFGFSVDVAADETNHKCALYCGPGGWLADGLLAHWPASKVWCNPPYRTAAQWVKKAAAQRSLGTTTVMLLPARPDTRYFHEFIWDRDSHSPRPGVEVRFLKGRLKFEGAEDPAPFPSMVVVFHAAEPA